MAFKPPPKLWMGKKIRVSGWIKSYRSIPEIIAYAPDQIQLSAN